MEQRELHINGLLHNMEVTMSNFTIKDMLAMQQALQENIRISGKQSAQKLVSINCCGCLAKWEKSLTLLRKMGTKSLLRM